MQCAAKEYRALLSVVAQVDTGLKGEKRRKMMPKIELLCLQHYMLYSIVRL